MKKAHISQLPTRSTDSVPHENLDLQRIHCLIHREEVLEEFDEKGGFLEIDSDLEMQEENDIFDRVVNGDLDDYHNDETSQLHFEPDP